MSTISQITGSLFSAVNESTQALANFNLDFSLAKIAAPEEYHGLGTALSQQRRENAEDGPLHRTAMRLGALFEQIIPPISSLAQAYGQRASEIAASSTQDLKHGADYGPFSQHIGVDGASIYAAATSGSNAIALHLLACMLARSWSGPEATSIWVELVAERKKEILENVDPSHMQGIVSRVAAQQEISRAQLAAWDSSARAWLRTADNVKKVAQTQLRLIVKNSGLPVGTSGTTYRSVIEAWCMAMTSLQKLIMGMPQNISKGSILVGLLSWHIYPDLNVVDPTANIQFHDPLVNSGGVVTLGLQRLDKTDGGVHWSLALSHLRFYGEPVPIEKSVGSDRGRLTIPELHLVALGSVLSTWQDPGKVDIGTAADCFVAIGEVIWGKHGAPYALDDSEYDSGLAWLRLLVSAAYRFVHSTSTDRENCVELVEHGRRGGRRFLDEELHNETPMFGLVNKAQLFQLCEKPEQDTEESIETLQSLAEQCNLHQYDCMIRYRGPLLSDVDANSIWEQVYTYRFTSAISDVKSSTKRHQDGTIKKPDREYWIHAVPWADASHPRDVDGHRLNSSRSRFIARNLFFFCPLYYQEYTSGNCPCILDKEQYVWSCICVESPSHITFKEGNSIELPESTPRCPPWRYYERFMELYQESGVPQLFEHQQYLANDKRGKELADEWLEHVNDIEYSFFAGDEKVALLLSSRASIPVPNWDVMELTQLLLSGTIDQSKLVRYLKTLSAKKCRGTEITGHRQDRLFTSLSSLIGASDLYHEWPEATISMDITKRELGAARWSRYYTTKEKNNQPNRGPVFFREAKFACIAMLESGIHDFYPDQLRYVFALAAGNSIYVAESLLQDPSLEDRSDQQKFCGIRRILGNLDRPGIVMLIPPQVPRLRKLNEHSRTLVQPKTFDGSLQDLFKNTSLHLMFTEYEISLAIAPGAFDAEVIMLEALVSVHEGRDWVADLDVIASLAKDCLKLTRPCSCVNEF